MTPTPYEQRNPYKGTPPRAWVRLRLKSLQGAHHEIDLLADTGSPFPIIVSQTTLSLLKHIDSSAVNSNFGPLQGAWLQPDMPELGLTHRVEGYGSDVLAASVQFSSPDFGGLLGLPLLQLMEYGGGATSFWVRPAANRP